MRPYCWLKIFYSAFLPRFYLIRPKICRIILPVAALLLRLRWPVWVYLYLSFHPTAALFCVGRLGFSYLWASFLFLPRQLCTPSSALAVWSLLGFSFPQLCFCHCFESFGVFSCLLWTIFDIFSFGQFLCFYFWQLLSLDVYFWWLMMSLGTLCCSGTIASIFEL